MLSTCKKQHARRRGSIGCVVGHRRRRTASSNRTRVTTTKGWAHRGCVGLVAATPWVRWPCCGSMHGCVADAYVKTGWGWGLGKRHALREHGHMCGSTQHVARHAPIAAIHTHTRARALGTHLTLCGARSEFSYAAPRRRDSSARGTGRTAQGGQHREETDVCAVSTQCVVRRTRRGRRGSCWSRASGADCSSVCSERARVHAKAMPRDDSSKAAKDTAHAHVCEGMHMRNAAEDVLRRTVDRG